MAQYQIFGSGNGGNGANGPSSSTSYGSTIVMGIAFEVTTSGLYLYSYRFWRCDSSQSASASFALWLQTGAAAGTYQGSSTAASTSSMVTATWNTVTLATPFALTASTPYKAQVGLTGNFPDTGVQFGDDGGSGAPYLAGITNGPLNCYSAPVAFSGTNQIPFTNAYQGSYETSSADPTAVFAAADSSSFNPWIDVIVGPAAAGVTAGRLVVSQAVKRAAFF